MIKVGPKDPKKTLKVLDISHYDGKIDYDQIKKDGWSAVIAKATQGISNIDETFEGHRNAFKKLGIPFGGYHYFEPNKDTMAQVEHYLKVIGKLEETDLPCVLDFEHSIGRLSDVMARSKAMVFLEQVMSRTKKVPIFCTGPYFARDELKIHLNPSFKKFPLWIMHYHTDMPYVPEPWDEWTLWQMFDDGDVKGIPAKDEDVDMFNGDLDDLKKLCAFIK